MDIHPIERQAMEDYEAGSVRSNSTHPVYDCFIENGRCTVCMMPVTSEMEDAHYHSRQHMTNVCVYRRCIDDMVEEAMSAVHVDQTMHRRRTIGMSVYRQYIACRHADDAHAVKFLRNVMEYTCGTTTSLDVLLHSFRASELPVPEGDRPRGTCVICLEVESAALFATCSHVAMCMRCARQVDKCPICRVEVSGAPARVNIS